jgi:hypothetical protein
VSPRAGVDILGKRKYLASAEMNTKVLNTRYTEMLSERVTSAVTLQRVTSAVTVQHVTSAISLPSYCT